MAADDELPVSFGSAEAAVSWAVERFGQRLALTCSFGGPSGMVLVDMAVRLDRSVPVVVLDTDLLFPETYALVERVERHYGITIRRAKPALSLEAQSARFGPELFADDPDRCCAIRKVEPLATLLTGFDAWLTAIRRDQTAGRAETPMVSRHERHQVVKICPLVAWTEADVWGYLHRHRVPYNPLLDRGFTSLGCVPCTRRPTGADPRSGRWSDHGKTECGLHL